MNYIRKLLCSNCWSCCCCCCDYNRKSYRATRLISNDIEQSAAATISDRATDEVVDALTRYKRGLAISDSPSVLDEPQTPDIVRSRSSHDSDGLISSSRGLNLPKLGLDSPTATPLLPSKRRSIARKIRPQSVVENLSLGHIPDLLESPSSRRSSNTSHDKREDECCDSITELPSASFQLQHLVKGRPKRAKTRAPSRNVFNDPATKEIGEGLEQFFRPGSVTPTTLTPLVSPTSEECSSLSFVDSPTMSRDDNGRFNSLTSEETTPILEERKHVKLDRSSPLLKDVDVVPFSQAHSGSIVGISPGTALSSGGSIVGITPGAALEKKSVKELAAGLNRSELMKKPQALPRKKLPANDNSNNPPKLSDSMSTTTVISSSSCTTTNSSVRTEVESGERTEVKKIAGKNITTMFEEKLVEGLQRSSFRNTIYREAQYSKDDTVDV